MRNPAYDTRRTHASVPLVCVRGTSCGTGSWGGSGAASITTAFDAASLPTQVTMEALGVTATTTNIFAKTGQWQSSQTTGGRKWEFTAGTDSTLRRVAERPNDPYGVPAAARDLSYDTALRIVGVTLGVPGGTYGTLGLLARESVSYDGHGRVETDVLDAADPVLDASQAYTYDAAGRLETWTLDGATTTYSSDAAGNLTGIDRPATGADTVFTPGEDNQLASAVTAGVTTTFAYDDFGRRTHESSSAGETDYTWNTLGQLTGIASEDATSTFEYGPSGMRERVTVVSAEGTATTEAVWAGGTLAAERDSDGTLYRYLYGPDSLPLELIVTAPNQQPVAYTFQCDRSGSVIALTDATGAAVATYAYDPWGAPLEAPTTGVGARNPLRYRGYYLDTSTGLYYLPARYYDPATARFLSPDPAAPSAGDPLSLNRYAYCVGDPVNADDPSGATIDIDGDGKLGYDDVHYQNEQAKSQARARSAAKQATSFGAAAASTVYAVLSWIAGNYPEQMTRAMSRLVCSFPGGRPPKVSWYDHSRASTKQALASLSPAVSHPRAISDCVPARVLLGWSSDDWTASGGDAIPVLARTLLGLPFSPSLWLTAGGLALTVFGGMVAIAGTGVACTGLGLPVGGGVVAAGILIAGTGVGLAGCGLMGIEAETGFDVVPWYGR